MQCDRCSEKKCNQGKDCLNLHDKIEHLYSAADQRIHRAATALEGNYYMQKTRVEELILFCGELGFERLGVAFCIGLESEAQVLCAYLRRRFTVFSICCKVCGVSKNDLELQKIRDERYEAMCNPLVQARVLQEKETQLNVMVGLCLGHDILFSKHSHAPSTTLIVKDRVLSHNPAGALYTRYYRNLIGKGSEE